MQDKKCKKFMVTQNNPQKWLRKYNPEHTENKNESGIYEEYEWKEFYNTLPSNFRDNVRFAKFALERGESGTFHLQGFILFRKDERRSYIYKNMPKADVKQCFGTIQQASTYIGNLDFQHADGSAKGGEVFWTWEVGSCPSGREAKVNGEMSPTEKRLDALKAAIDADKGKNIIRRLWQSDFYMMLRYSRGIKEYIADTYTIDEAEGIRIGTITLAKEKELREEVFRLNKEAMTLVDQRERITNEMQEEIDMLKMQIEILSRLPNDDNQSNGRVLP